MAIAILGIIASLAIPSYSEYVDRTRNAQAMSDLSSIESAIERFYIANQRYPNSLTELGSTGQDPWNNNYNYLNILNNPRNARRARKDKLNQPINTDYDLYSNGKDTLTRQNISGAGNDDIIRGRNGRFVGLAKDY